MRPPALAVPPPFNGKIVFLGNCHIPTGQYSGGYSKHIKIFRKYYGWKPPMVLHRCGRPYCDQPGHLSPGDAQLNADDRRLMAGKGRFSFAHPRIREFAMRIEPIRVAPDPSWGLPFEGVEFPELCDDGQHVWGPLSSQDYPLCQLCHASASGQARLCPPILFERFLHGRIATPRLQAFERRLDWWWHVLRLEFGRLWPDAPWIADDEEHRMQDMDKADAVRHMWLTLHAQTQ